MKCTKLSPWLWRRCHAIMETLVRCEPEHLQWTCRIWCFSRNSCRARLKCLASGSCQWSGSRLPQHAWWCGALQRRARGGGSRETSARLRLGGHVWRCSRDRDSWNIPQPSHRALSGNQSRVRIFYHVTGKFTKGVRKVWRLYVGIYFIIITDKPKLVWEPYY